MPKLGDASKVYHGADLAAKVYHGANLAWSGASWQESFAIAMNYDAGWGAYSIRSVYPASELSASGTKIRVTLTSAITQPLTLAYLSIGERDGTSVNTVLTPVEITFSGGHGCSLSSGGVTIISDEIPFPFDETRDYLIISDLSGGWTSMRSGAGKGSYYKIGSSYNESSPSGFGVLDAGYSYINVSKIEVLA